MYLILSLLHFINVDPPTVSNVAPIAVNSVLHFISLPKSATLVGEYSIDAFFSSSSISFTSVFF